MNWYLLDVGWLRAKKPGPLRAFGDANKIWDDLERAIISKNMPEEWHFMPYRARKAIPVLITLDGDLIYPQVKGSIKHGNNPPAAAWLFGMAKNSVFLGLNINHAFSG